MIPSGNNIPKRTLIHLVASNSWGGPERHALDICRHFAAAGWTVTAVTRDARAVDTPFANEGIPLRHAPLRDYPDFFSSPMLASLLKSIPPGEGIIHTHRYRDVLTALMARRIARRPDIRIISTRHRVAPARDGWLPRIAYRAVDSHLFVSRFAMDVFLSTWQERTSPLAEARMAVTYNSLLLPFDSPEPEPDRGPVWAVYRGRLAPGKGIETLIRAMGRLRDLKLRLRIIGTGSPDFTDRLRSLAERLEVMDHIDWIRSADFAAPLLMRSHFGVFPSAGAEAFGVPNLELMACGRPQISTLTGGQREFLSPDSDVLEVHPADVESLASAMRLMATDPDLRRRIGAAARAKYDALYSWPKFIERLLPVYL